MAKRAKRRKQRSLSRSTESSGSQSIVLLWGLCHGSESSVSLTIMDIYGTYEREREGEHARDDLTNYQSLVGRVGRTLYEARVVGPRGRKRGLRLP
jgi:hypothetical protein